MPRKNNEPSSDNLPDGARPFLFQRGRARAIPALRYTRFRSQFEVHFVLELEARGFHWFYEPERLGEGRYLVDFYLPECKSWVELKGRMQTRDDVVLREVAGLLSVERHHHLLLFMPRKAYLVLPGSFSPMTHDAFWALLDRLKHAENNGESPNFSQKEP